MEPLHGAAYGETEFEYTENAVNIKSMGVQIILEGGRFRLNGKREMLVSALPIIDRILVKRDVAWIHAATVDYRGHGICMPAWGGVGKTSTIAKLLKLDGVAFMGDDWAFVSRDGRLLGYAKPMFIKPHHRPIYPHLFAKKRKPLVPSRLSQPIARLTTIVHPLITQYPQLARVTRRWSPEHMMVTPRQAFPHARISTSAPLATSVFVERYEGTNAVLRERDKSWMITRMLGNFHAEVSQHSHEVINALGATNLVSLDQYFSEKAAIIGDALGDKPTYLLQVPRAWSADRASDVIVENLRKVFADIGIE